MDERKIIKDLINKKLEKYFIYNKLVKIEKYRFEFKSNFIFMDNWLSNMVKYRIYGFKIGNIHIDSSLNIYIEKDNYYDIIMNLIINGKLVVNNTYLPFNEKVQNISNYLDYVFKVENN